MLNVIPGFIQDKLKMAPNRRSGSFMAVSLFVDIAGFTGITEKLMSRAEREPKTCRFSSTRYTDPLSKKYTPTEGS